MQFNDQNKCVQCNRLIPKHGHPDYEWWPEHTFLAHPYDFHFCSRACYNKALEDLLPEYIDELSPDLQTTLRKRAQADISDKIDQANEYWLVQRDARIHAEVQEEHLKKLEKERVMAERQEAKRLELQRLQEEEEAAFEELIQPRDIPPHLRFEHTHILGPSGSGKTTLLQHIFLNDLYDYKTKSWPTLPAYIIIDPKGEMVERIANMQLFAPSNMYHDKLVVIDPLDHPALNIFQSTGRNPAQIISTFGYIFSTTKQRLTGKQETCFSFCIELLFKMQGSNLFTLLDLLDDKTKDKAADPKFAAAISKLNAPSEMAVRRFLETDFYSSTYASTRQEIKTRVWEVLKNEHLLAMLNAPERKLDIARCIQERKIILVNTRMIQLKEAHQTLGRYIISLAVDAIQSRAGTPQNTWTPVFILIDEFQEFADEIMTPQMLRLMREYKGGAVLAHHNMYPTEFNDGIRSAISTNTSIKYCSDPRGMDINYMARDLQCNSEFLTRRCRKDAEQARFGCYFVGLDHPFLYEIPFGEIDRWPKMTPSQNSFLRKVNKLALQSTQAPAFDPFGPPVEELSDYQVTPTSTDEDGSHTKPFSARGKPSTPSDTPESGSTW